MAITNYAEAWIDQYANQLPTINFVSGDYTSLKESIREYVSLQCPEDYNDWMNSSEVGIFVNGLSYLGSIINYRVDLNAHDIFPSTTERRQSLLNFVKMLSYSPKRNIAALGIAKITSIKTSEAIYDSLGNSLENVTIKWNDNINENWQEQFLTILNKALIPNNPFGKPLKKITDNGINTQLYELNNLKNDRCSYPFTAVVNGYVRQFEMVNPTLDTDLLKIDEKTPVPEQGFNILYRNDGSGNSSANTGFFIYWKQGSLNNKVIYFDEKIENNSFDINQININNNDVWFQSVDIENNTVKENWEKVSDNEYLVYNNLNNEVRNIFKVETKDDDDVVLRFSDGKFGTIPIGYFRVWYRVSDGNYDMFVKPNDILNVSVTIPYKSLNSSDDNNYSLTIEFSVSSADHINQSVPQETMEYIRERAPELYSTQNRMVTGSDYNYFPKSFTQRIKILKAIERVYSGNTRYIDFNDPTGNYQDIKLVAEDGYMYSNSGIYSTDIPSDDWTTIDELIELFNKELRKIGLSNFYYEKFPLRTDLNYNGYPYTWKELINYGTNSSLGYFAYGEDEDYTSIPYMNVANKLKVGSLIKINGKNEGEIVDTSWITIGSMKENIIFSENDDHTQEIIINDSLNPNLVWEIEEYYEPFNITFSEDLRSMVYNLFNENTSFGLRYNIDNNTFDVMDYDSLADGEWVGQDEPKNGNKECTDWLIKAQYNSSNYWTFTSRYFDYIFGSANDVSFFFNTSIKNNNGTFFTEDYIKILKHQSDLELNKDYYWKPCNILLYSDGYVDSNKFKVYGYDNDRDTTIDNPTQYRELLNGHKEKIFFGINANDDKSVMYDNVIELNTLWNTIDKGVYKNYTATNVSNYYYLKVPCSVYPAGYKIPKRIDGTDIKIYITETTTLSDGHIVYASQMNPVLIAESGKIYTYDVVDVGHTISYHFNNDGEIVIDEDNETNYRLSNEYSSDNISVYVGNDDYRYKIYDNEYSLVYWSSSDKNIDFIDESNYVIKEGVKNIIFMWKHYATMKYLIDPSTTNIIDMYVLTNNYWNQVQTWINNGKKEIFPKLPSEYELKRNFAELENYKMISDTLVWHSISYKVLFGTQASEELRAIFKVVKNDETILSDNEIKQKIIQVIDEYFSSMKPGETFFFTQLSSYIHNKLGNNIGTVLLVPTYNDEKFGNLFEIQCEPDEILISGASIEDIQIISRITDYNIRISQ